MQHSLVTPLGTYSLLGVAGYTIHGGIGFLSRTHGCAIDNVLEFGKLNDPCSNKFYLVFTIYA